MTCPINLAAETAKSPHASSLAAQRAIIAAAGGKPFAVPESMWQELRLAYLDEEVVFRERALAQWRSAEACVALASAVAGTRA